MPALRTRDTQSRTLEVTTDAPNAPSFNIVSPTPRAFTFPPPTQSLADSPYSSPSSSPFEPDLRSFPSQCTLVQSSSTTITPPPPPYTHLRPDSPVRPPSPPTHKRRRSSCSSDVVERRPKKGDEDYIKRPENAFILFRRKCCEDRQAEEEAAKTEGAKKPRQADLSKTISQMWKGLPSEERQKWEAMAKEKKKEHEQMYPNYVYRPQRSKDKDGKAKLIKKASIPRKTEESEPLSFVVPVPRPHGRSTSAPGPPYQSIQIPNIYHLTPSCPTSPSLLPMISRRSGFPGHQEDIMANFDYKPSPNYAPPPFAMPDQSQFEANIQGSDFLRNIFRTNAPEHRNSEPSLQHLTIGSPDASFLPPGHLVSPSSSNASGSSGPSSPATGPYTPGSASLIPSDFTSGDAALDAQAQAEMDLQIEMQMQQEFATFTWGDNSVWSSEPSILLEDDFDISAIPPINLGVSKYTENHPLGIASNASGLEFGQEFAHTQYRDESQNMGAGLIGFDELMAGHSF